MRRRDANVEVLIVQIRGRWHSILRVQQVASTNYVAEPVRFLEVQDAVMQDEQSASVLDIRLNVLSDGVGRLQRLIVEDDDVVARCRIVLECRVEGGRVIPRDTV